MSVNVCGFHFVVVYKMAVCWCCQLVVRALLHHVTVVEVVVSAVGCLFYLLKPENIGPVAPRLMKQVVRVVITALETHIYSPDVSHKSQE